MTRNGHRFEWREGKRPDGQWAAIEWAEADDSVRNPPRRFRQLLVGLVYGVTGAVAGALAAIPLGSPVVCIVAGGLAGVMLGVWIEAT